MRNIIVIGILGMLMLSSIMPLTISIKDEIDEKNNNFEHLFYKCYDKTEYESLKLSAERENIKSDFRSDDFNEFEELNLPTDPLIPEITSGPMNSPWSMYCHDVHHTGRSPYSTASNTGYEEWIYSTWGWIQGGVVIGDDGTIYYGSYDWGFNHGVYALYPNGTLNWKGAVGGRIECTPAIAEDGTIYVGTSYGSNGLYAISGDGTFKWMYSTGNHVHSSPAIDQDGTIYFGDWNGWINALYPNGTLKWRYKTGNAVLSSPAIGDNGVVYCGSHDNNLYALYTNNGTVKWIYPTGGWVRVSPCIGDDGTIFFVSFDCYIYAVNQDGSLKWKTNMGEAGTSPTIGHDGTIYAGYTKLRAINPENGSIKWTYNPGQYRYICGSNPANSLDGTIYFGTNRGIGKTDGGELIAVNPNGTQKWRSRRIANAWIDSPCSISEDGKIYIGTSSNKNKGGNNWHSAGDLYSFNILDPNAPSVPTIDGPTNGLSGRKHTFNFSADDPNGDDVYYYINWGDGCIEKKIGPFSSGEEGNATHDWYYCCEGSKKFTIRARSIDTNNLWGPWTTHQIEIFVNHPPSNPHLPSGQIFVKIGIPYIYSTSSTDPEGARIKYFFNWNDDSWGEWTDYAPSGEEVSVSHTWMEPGIYQFRVYAEDEDGVFSGWSPSLIITATRSKEKSIFFTILTRILENNPNAFPILRYLLELL